MGADRNGLVPAIHARGARLRHDSLRVAANAVDASLRWHDGDRAHANRSQRGMVSGSKACRPGRGSGRIESVGGQAAPPGGPKLFVSYPRPEEVFHRDMQRPARSAPCLAIRADERVARRRSHDCRAAAEAVDRVRSSKKCTLSFRPSQVPQALPTASSSHGGKPISSANSRRAAASGVSPRSTPPPGNVHASRYDGRTNSSA